MSRIITDEFVLTASNEGTLYAEHLALAHYAAALMNFDNSRGRREGGAVHGRQMARDAWNLQAERSYVRINQTCFRNELDPWDCLGAARRAAYADALAVYYATEIAESVAA